MDKQADRQMEGQMDGQTLSMEKIIPPPPPYHVAGYKNV